MGPGIKAMSTSTCRIFQTLARLAFAFIVSVSFTQAQGGKRGPTSKLYVVEVNGSASIKTGSKIEPLTPKATYDADDIVIETTPGSTCVVVLSNGTAISMSSDSQLVIRRFTQEPFTPNRVDLDLEPSISQTIAFLTRGAVALSTSNLVPGSTMIFSSRYSSVAIRGRKALIETDDTRMTVSLLEGAATIRDELIVGGETIRAGQQAVVTRVSSFSPPVIVIQPIPTSDLKRIEDAVAVASMARTTVYFDATQRGGVAGGASGESDQEIVTVPVLPGTLSPPNTTVSPFRIR
jgi:hypothetical protein